MPWAAQVTCRLSEEFVTRVPLADIIAGIERAKAELDTVSAAALPEMVERLVRFRLRSLAGRATGSGADGGTDDADPNLTNRRPAGVTGRDAVRAFALRSRS